MPNTKTRYEAQALCGWPRKFVLYTATSKTAFGAYRQMAHPEDSRFYRVEPDGKRTRVRLVANGRYSVRELPFRRAAGPQL